MTYLKRVKTIWSFKSIRMIKEAIIEIFDDFRHVLASLSFSLGSIYVFLLMLILVIFSPITAIFLREDE